MATSRVRWLHVYGLRATPGLPGLPQGSKGYLRGPRATLGIQGLPQDIWGIPQGFNMGPRGPRTTPKSPKATQGLGELPQESEVYKGSKGYLISQGVNKSIQGISQQFKGYQRALGLLQWFKCYIELQFLLTNPNKKFKGLWHHSKKVKFALREKNHGPLQPIGIWG